MIELHSRTVRIGGPELALGCGYRDVAIHEMTEHEIEFLKTQRWIGFAAGILVGYCIAGMIAVASLPS